ncbi:threonine-phosphate decarboxylase CobD [Bradyrhizobium sp. Arg237L]|uniref:threonine-phosphate decarboxylase CobD n=1 Tax=Bradyrhizobium sp. Arg237L TaxID=3003352 RepID=UPI00249F94C1|nr:threonine-phosphate decarboxylase CobD [Bradyrhizobium sp. Arg237L]MDI4235128.1 threonine-phosphate decarboxylase CobD [Bradyrhizobium sp. Arg237L]
MKHGGDLTEAIARHGGEPADWLDLSTGINPWPWTTRHPVPGSAWTRLPSRADEQDLLAAAREAFGVPDDADIAAATGTQTLIQWIPYLAGPGAVAIVSPTYGEHSAAWSSGGREILAVNDLSALPERAIHAVVVNPNNPDGRIADGGAFRHVAERLDRRGGWLVIDEAFADVDPAISAARMSADLPILVLRSFGKFYGLAGLRLGFVIGRRDIVERISAALGPWPVSGPALHLGTAALRDRSWADETRVKLARQSSKLDHVLTEAGLQLVGGTTLFRLASHPDAPNLHTELARRHIWCRSFDWAREWLRFGLASDDGLDRLASAFRSIG